MKNKEYYKDIIEYIELRFSIESALIEINCTKDFYREQLLKHIIEKTQDKVDEWLEQEKKTV